MKGRKTGGRQKGTKNKVNTDVRMASLRAMHAIGKDGQGEGGVDGYMEAYARSNPGQFQKSVVPRLIPTAIDGGLDEGGEQLGIPWKLQPVKPGADRPDR